MSLIPVGPKDLLVGIPLLHTIYDKEGRTLFAKGTPIDTQAQIDRLLAEGAFRKPTPTGAIVDGNSPPTRPVGEPQLKAASAPKQDVGTPQRYALDAIKMRIGDMVQLQTNDENSPMRYTCRLMGFLKNRSVIVSNPMVEDKTVMVREGQAFVVRLFSGKDCYAFTVSVIKPVNVPYPYIHLSYPSEVVGMSIRRHARVKVKVIAAIFPGDSGGTGKMTPATIQNMSVGGGMIAAKAPLGEKGDKIIVKFKLMLEGLEHVYAMNAAIRSVTLEKASPGDPGLYVHGTEFLEVDPKDAISLSAYIYRLLAEQLAESV